MSTLPKDIATYLREFAHLLEDRILEQFPPLHEPGTPLPPELRHLRRTPYPAQSLAIAGIAKRWDIENSAGAIAECGTGKTLISLGAMYVHAKGRPFTALVMVPPQLTMKWCRECLILQEGPPGLRRRLPPACHVLAHAGLADFDTKFEQFAVDAGRAPKRILAAHSTDQFSHIFRDRRSARLAMTNFPAPEQPEALAMPGHDGLRLDDDQGRSPIVPNFA